MLGRDPQAAPQEAAGAYWAAGPPPRRRRAAGRGGPGRPRRAAASHLSSPPQIGPALPKSCLSSPPQICAALLRFGYSPEKGSVCLCVCSRYCRQNNKIRRYRNADGKLLVDITSRALFRRIAESEEPCTNLRSPGEAGFREPWPDLRRPGEVRCRRAQRATRDGYPHH